MQFRSFDVFAYFPTPWGHSGVFLKQKMNLFLQKVYLTTYSIVVKQFRSYFTKITQITLEIQIVYNLVFFDFFVVFLLQLFAKKSIRQPIRSLFVKRIWLFNPENSQRNLKQLFKNVEKL